MSAMAMDDMEPYMRGGRRYNRVQSLQRCTDSDANQRIPEEADEAYGKLLALLRKNNERCSLSTYKYKGSLVFCPPTEMAARFLEDLLADPAEIYALMDLLWQIEGSCDYEGRDANMCDLLEEWLSPFSESRRRISPDWVQIDLLEYWEDMDDILELIRPRYKSYGADYAADDSVLR